MEMGNERLPECLMAGQAGRLEFLEGRNGRLSIPALRCQGQRHCVAVGFVVEGLEPGCVAANEAQNSHSLADRRLRRKGNRQRRPFDHPVVLPRYAVDNRLHVCSHVFHDLLQGQRLRCRTPGRCQCATQCNQPCPCCVAAAVPGLIPDESHIVCSSSATCSAENGTATGAGESRLRDQYRDLAERRSEAVFDADVGRDLAFAAEVLDDGAVCRIAHQPLVTQ